MKKLSLNEFIQESNNFDYIEEPKLILSVVRKMRDIPFDEIFHEKRRYQEQPTPWEYIYKVFVDEELVPENREAFGALPYGKIAFLLNEEIKRASAIVKTGKNMLLESLMTEFGSMYMHFIQ